MNDKTCSKCKHLCHCMEADHEGCECVSCDCERGRAEQSTYENNNDGLVVDDTGECESCQ